MQHLADFIARALCGMNNPTEMISLSAKKGISLVIPNAGKVIHEAAMRMRFRAKQENFIDLIHVYPTMVEALKIAAISYFKDPAKLSRCAERKKTSRRFASLRDVCFMKTLPLVSFDRETPACRQIAVPINFPHPVVGIRLAPGPRPKLPRCIHQNAVWIVFRRYDLRLCLRAQVTSHAYMPAVWAAMNKPNRARKTFFNIMPP